MKGMGDVLRGCVVLVTFTCTYIKRLFCLSRGLKVIQFMSVTGLWKIYRTAEYKRYKDFERTWALCIC
jgi:hypothetical protein